MPKTIQCLSCKHYYGGCHGFPDGIPHAIFFSEFIHTKEYPGDRGYRYEHVET
ncbi:MAG: hypothetical protein ACXVIG_08400 [Halobacteriota archaeon]